MVKNNKTGFFSIKLRDEKMELDIIGLVSACSYALDCIEAELVHVTNRHGKRVAYISVCMAEKFGIIGEALQDLAMCALPVSYTHLIEQGIRQTLSVLRLQNRPRPECSTSDPDPCQVVRYAW